MKLTRSVVTVAIEELQRRGFVKRLYLGTNGEVCLAAAIALGMGAAANVNTLGDFCRSNTFADAVRDPTQRLLNHHFGASSIESYNNKDETDQLAAVRFLEAVRDSLPKETA